MYAVNCSVPKTLVRHLVKAEARRLGGRTEKILQDILATEISPELLPPDAEGRIAQKTEDIIGPYELHDFYLYHFVRRGDAPEKVLFFGGEGVLRQIRQGYAEKVAFQFLPTLFCAAIQTELCSGRGESRLCFAFAAR